jgi:hypothetical protein
LEENGVNDDGSPLLLITTPGDLYDLIMIPRNQEEKHFLLKKIMSVKIYIESHHSMVSFIFLHQSMFDWLYFLLILSNF